jgi:hypothetical protein
MTDRTTKVLLALIALGLWANFAVDVFRPATASAQDVSGIERKLSGIERDLSSIASSLARIGTDVTSIERNVDNLEDGTCRNKKLCN